MSAVCRSYQIFPDTHVTLRLAFAELFPDVGTDMTKWSIRWVLKLTRTGPALLTKTATVTGATDPDRWQNTQVASVVLTPEETRQLNTSPTGRLHLVHSWARINPGLEAVLAHGDVVVMATAYGQ